MGEYSKKSPRYFSYNIYVYRKPELDEFSHHSHVENINTPIIKPLLEKYGAISYTVVCRRPENALTSCCLDNLLETDSQRRRCQIEIQSFVP